MRKFVTKLAALAAAAAMALSSTPALAAETTYTSGTGSMEVTFSIGSVWYVSVPDEITLDTELKTATYDVSIYGVLPAGKDLTVTPSASVLFRAPGEDKLALSGAVTQTKTRWSAGDVGADKASATTTDGTITVAIEKIPAGQWAADIEFTVATVDETP